MWLLTFLITAFLSIQAQASTQVRAQIYDIDFGKNGEETLLFLTTGHVARFSGFTEKNSFNLKQLKKERAWISFTLNDKHEIEGLYLAPEPESFIGSVALTDADEVYNPTIVEGMDQARKYFKDGRYINRESQCYNRAHVWSYEWFLKHTLFSNKTWLFFTRKYIRKFKFEWWFHVAPSIYVRDNGVIKEKVMDLKYSTGPSDLKRWTDIFMRNKAHCPQVKTYSDYANYPESGWCFTMRTSMFYYQPFDIESKETWGTIKGNWYDTEIKSAFEDALGESI